MVENLIFPFKQKRKDQGQKFTENTPSVDLANTKLSVMKMQKMLGELTEEEKGHLIWRLIISIIML